MIKDGTHSRFSASPSVCIWYPKAGSFSINPHQPPDEDTFWYYELAPGVSISVGRYRGDLADDIDAMRQLSADAAELARLLEAKLLAAQKEDAADA